jgi:hypothetical protein
VRVDKDSHLELRNPFHTYASEAAEFVQALGESESWGKAIKQK